MRYMVLILVLVVACSCPEGSIEFGGKCIGQASFCQSNKECSSAKFVCSRECVNEPVNVAFLEKAKAKEKSCPRTVACRDSPEFIETWCEDNVCRASTKYAGDFVSPVQLLDVMPNAKACVRKGLNGSMIRLTVFNNDSLPLENIQAIIMGSAPLSADMNASTQRELLFSPIPPLVVRNVSIPILPALGDVAQVSLLAVRHVRFSGFDAGSVVGDRSPVRLANVSACV